jgi:hypothetical protein
MAWPIRGKCRNCISSILFSRLKIRFLQRRYHRVAVSTSAAEGRVDGGRVDGGRVDGGRALPPRCPPDSARRRGHRRRRRHRCLNGMFTLAEIGNKSKYRQNCNRFFVA